MLIQDAKFPEIAEVEKPFEIKAIIPEETETIIEENEKTDEVVVPRNKGGRPRKN